MLNLLWRAGVRIRAFPASVRLPVRRGGAVVTSRVRSFAASAQGHGRGLMARFDAALDQRPWTTNLVVCVALYAVGDTIEQVGGVGGGQCVVALRSAYRVTSVAVYSAMRPAHGHRCVGPGVVLGL